jgi:hypothetical protein
MKCSNEFEGARLARDAMNARNFATFAQQIEFLLSVINKTLRSEQEINKLKEVLNGGIRSI